MIRINLAPPQERRHYVVVPRLHLGLVLALVAVVLVVGLAGYGRSLWVEEGRLVAEIETEERELAALKATVGRAGKIKEQLADLQARLRSIEMLAKGQSRPFLLIDAFADAVPADLWITKLEEKNALLRVTGSAFSPTAVANFMAALRASRKFKDVDITLSKRDAAKTPSVVDFEVTCRFEG
jgi:Tfp pilus assembly protein PilN